MKKIIFHIVFCFVAFSALAQEPTSVVTCETCPYVTIPPATGGPNFRTPLVDLQNHCPGHMVYTDALGNQSYYPMVRVDTVFVPILEDDYPPYNCNVNRFVTDTSGNLQYVDYLGNTVFIRPDTGLIGGSNFAKNGLHRIGDTTYLGGQLTKPTAINSQDNGTGVYHTFNVNRSQDHLAMDDFGSVLIPVLDPNTGSVRLWSRSMLENKYGAVVTQNGVVHLFSGANGATSGHIELDSGYVAISADSYYRIATPEMNNGNNTDPTGHVLTAIDAQGNSEWQPTAATHDPVTLGIANNPALSITAQQLNFEPLAANSWGHPDFTATTLADAIIEAYQNDLNQKNAPIYTATTSGQARDLAAAAGISTGEYYKWDNGQNQTMTFQF